MKFIHVTDTHLLKRGELLHQLDPLKRFKLCVRSIRENHKDAYCIVVTGDLADRGEQEAYQLFMQEMLTTGLPVYSILGNHDERDNYKEHFTDASVDSAGFLQTAIKTPVGVFLLLDTKLDGSHSGTFCELRLQWLQDTLDQHYGDPVFLFMHHPPFDLHLPCIDKIGLKEKDAFASVVNSHANVRHIFFGHAHRPLCGHWKGISFSSMRGTNHQVKLDFNDEKIHPISEDPEYAIVFVDDDRLIVHTHSFLSDFV